MQPLTIALSAAAALAGATPVPTAASYAALKDAPALGHKIRTGYTKNSAQPRDKVKAKAARAARKRNRRK